MVQTRSRILESISNAEPQPRKIFLAIHNNDNLFPINFQQISPKESKDGSKIQQCVHPC